MAGSQKKININEGEDFDNFREVNAFALLTTCTNFRAAQFSVFLDPN